jgi:hypothetical protein
VPLAVVTAIVTPHFSCTISTRRTSQTTTLTGHAPLASRLCVYGRQLGAFAIVLNLIIGLFYRGLLELSKSFLDPFGNRRMSASGLSADISIPTLIGEVNAGSLVWPQGASRLPFDVGQYVHTPATPELASRSDAMRGAINVEPPWQA